ncbi:HYC_CC_PP family protein [Maribellus mangrovi]|uniref:HYC_CC_PP family protein n=1 Tax=Maribellus mangrovi TaxID=3133146 RepID=UPI0030ED6746
MIKKLSHIVFATLLLVSTIGMAVSKHYCHNSLVGVSFFSQADSCCDDGGCCTNENQFYQIKEDFSAPVISTVPILAELEVLQQTLFDFDVLTPNELTEEFTLTSDPPPPTVPELLAWEQVYLL